MACGLRKVGLAAALALAPTAAPAITWNIDFGSVATTFEAPAGGGAVTGLVVTLGGLEFNTPEAGGSAPVFDPVENHFEPIGGGLVLRDRHADLLWLTVCAGDQRAAMAWRHHARWRGDTAHRMDESRCCGDAAPP